jgi:hypothetical protein
MNLATSETGVISAERSFSRLWWETTASRPGQGSFSRLWWETYAAGHEEGLSRPPAASTSQVAQRDNARHGD